jgi:hypothetical protein
MSGGHWNYQQYTLSSLAEDIQEDIDRSGKLNEYGEKYPDDPVLIQGGKCAVNLLEAAAELVKSLDWCYSGDTGPDTVARDILAWKEKHMAKLVYSISEMAEAAKNTP